MVSLQHSVCLVAFIKTTSAKIFQIVWWTLLTQSWSPIHLERRHVSLRLQIQLLYFWLHWNVAFITLARFDIDFWYWKDRKNASFYIFGITVWLWRSGCKMVYISLTGSVQNSTFFTKMFSQDKVLCDRWGLWDYGYFNCLKFLLST